MVNPHLRANMRSRSPSSLKLGPILVWVLVAIPLPLLGSGGPTASGADGPPAGLASPLLVPGFAPAGTEVSGLSTSPSMEFVTENLRPSWRPDIRYVLSTGAVQVGFIDSGILVYLRGGGDPLSSRRLDAGLDTAPALQARPATLLRIRFPGAQWVRPEGRLMLPHRTNYLVGNDPALWARGARSFREVVYKGLYPGIDLVYRPSGSGLKYEFLVRPGGDPSQIAISYDGADGLDLDPSGGLTVRAPAGILHDRSPVSFQGADPVACSIGLRGRTTYGFDCAGWDTTQPLVIDPLLYSTFLGGADSDWALSIAVDAAGNAYVVGRTFSADFPATAGAYNTTYSGGNDVFIAKLNPAGSAFVYVTYLGGTRDDVGSSIVLDGAGNAYVAGRSQSPDFPTTPGVIAPVYNGGVDAFVAELDASGSSLVYSTYLGGSKYDSAASISIDSGGNAYVVGRTTSNDLPTTAGAYNVNFNGDHDLFAAKVAPGGTSLVYATYIGGIGYEVPSAAGIDPAGNVYITGRTNSTAFPTTSAAFDRTYNGGTDTFVTKLNPAGAGLVYSTYLGGSNYDPGDGLAVDAAGNVFVTSRTNSTDFPTTVGAFDRTYHGGSDIFVTKLNAAGAGLVYSTYVGGTGYDSGDAVDLDAAGAAYLTGHTTSTDFPVTLGAYDTTFNGVNDSFVLEMDPGGAVVYSTYLGGSSMESADGLALDAAANVYLTGKTSSADYPTTLGAPYRTFSGFNDSFITKLNVSFVQVTVDTVPAGLQVIVAGQTFTAPHSFGCGRDTPVALSVPSPQVVALTRSTFASWSDGGAQTHSITCLSAGTYTAFFSTEYQVTVDTAPPGLQVRIDGVTSFAPQTFWCSPSGSHTLEALSPQANGSARYAFLSWSDGGLQMHSVTCVGPSTFTVTYSAEFLVTVDTAPTGLQIVVDSVPTTAPLAFWCTSGSPHTVSTPSLQNGTPTSRLAFASWSDGGAQTHTTTCTASANLTATFVTQFNVTLDTQPGALDVQADGGWSAAPVSYWWTASSGHTILVNATQIGLNFASWSDGGAIAHVHVATRAETIVANYTAAPVPLALTATANVTAGTAPLPVSFTAASSGGEPPYVWWWDFDDGSGSSAQNPAHVFLNPGSYNVTIQVNDSGSPRNSTARVLQIVVTFTPPTMTSCTVTPDPASVLLGDNRQFSIQAWNGTLPITGATATWSVLGGIGTISTAGLFSAMAVGSGSVAANVSHGGRSALCSAAVTVVPGAPPTVFIVSPPNLAIVTTNSLNASGTATQATLVQVRVGGGTWTGATGLASWTAALDLSAFPNGNVVIEARSFNGTVESTHASVTVVKKVVLPSAPTVAFQVPVNGATVTLTLLNVSGTASNATVVQVRAGTGPWQAATGIASWTIALNLGASADGPIVLEARAFNGTTESDHDFHTVFLQLPVPAVTILRPADASVVHPGPEVVSGTSQNAVLVQVRLDTGPWTDATGTATWAASIDFTAVPLGVHAISARAVNGLREATAQVTVFEQLQGPSPEVAITAPVNGTTVTTASVTVRGTAANVTSVQVNVDNGTWFDASGTSAWSVDLLLAGMPPGTHVITAIAWNGTTSSAPAATTIDYAPASPGSVPLEVITPLEDTAVSATMVLAGTSMAGATVTIWVGGTVFSNVTVGSDGNWTANFDTTGLADGRITFSFQAALGGTTSTTIVRHVTVSNGSGPRGPVQGFPWWLVLVLVAGIALILFFVWRRRRKEKPGEDLPPPPPPDAPKGDGKPEEPAAQVFSLPRVKRRRDPRVLRRLGAMLGGFAILALGAATLYTSESSHEYRSTFNILANRYFKITANLRTDTTVVGEFQETSGRTVTFLIMGSVQFTSYQRGQNIGNLYAIPDVSSGSISYQATSTDTYYLIFTHGPGLLNTTETVTLRRQYVSHDEFKLLVGGLLVILGPLETYWAWRAREEPEPPAPVSRKR